MDLSQLLFVVALTILLCKAFGVGNNNIILIHRRGGYRDGYGGGNRGGITFNLLA
jgi:hypothetical protein